MSYALIDSIKENSIALELGLTQGDKILEINDQPVGDILDYMIHIADDYLEVKIQHKDGEEVIYAIEKDFDEDLGIKFMPPTITKITKCHNNCKFCFVSQMPEGLRDTLYIKDDDYRLSFLSGSYITGTNLSPKDIDRIKRLNLSPLYISVHQTRNRNDLIGHKKEFNILEFLKELKDSGICFHTQIVLCPDNNDKETLRQTLKDLDDLLPNLLSIAVVPVGLTKFRDNLPKMRPFTRDEARDVIEQCNSYGDKYVESYKKRVIYLSDELYLKAEVEVPQESYYDDYSQLENGIGMIRLFINQFNDSFKKNYDKIGKLEFSEKFIIVTGELAGGYIDKCLTKIRDINSSFNFEIAIVKNDFFGKLITVAGLLVGQDIKRELETKEKNSIVLLPKNMLQYNTERFLDDMTVGELRDSLSMNILSIEVNGDSLLAAIMNKGVR